MNTQATIKVGDRVTFNRPADSFYTQASGVVTKVNGAWISVQADKGRSRFERAWKSIDCAMACNVNDLINA